MKLLKKIILIIIIFIIISYFTLWIYVTKSVPKTLKEIYDQQIVFDISENQYNLMWFVWTENKNYRFVWYPFLFKIGKNNDNLDNYISFFLINSNEIFNKPYGLQVWHINYGLARYIRKDNNYKKCLSVIIEKCLYDRSQQYYNKGINDLTDKELIKLMLSIESNHYLYSNRTEIRVAELLLLFNNS